MTLMNVSTQGSVAILTMTTAENRHNPAFAEAFLNCLDEIEHNPEHKALVITSSSEKSWSLGIDTDWLMPALKAQKFAEVSGFMHSMDAVFKRLLLFPMPVIAAINGHAFGNGAILSCACDFRFMQSDRGFFCFPEVDLSIPFLPGMLAFIKKAIPDYRFNEMMLTGRRVTAGELATDHVIEQACPNSEALFNIALEFASQFDKKRAIFAEHKKRLHKHIIDTIDIENKPIIDAVQLVV